MIRNVLAWLERSAHRRPDAVWLRDPLNTLTFSGAMRRAMETGTFLARRIPARKPVLILADKAPETVAMMLGAVYAGCFYTPADASMPEARLRLVAEKLQPAVILYDRKYEQAAGRLGIQAFAFDEVACEVDEQLLKERRRDQIDTDLLYVLFTSGSTGTPKGVAISHRSVIDFISWAEEALCLTEENRFGSQAPLYFDNSVLDLYGSLCAGGCVCFLPRSHFGFPGRLLEDLKTMSVNTLFWVPSALTALAGSEVREALADTSLTNIFFCGEVMPCRTLNRLRDVLPEARYVNMYGPTEITDVCCWYEVDRTFADTDSLPIGFPCANTRIRLMDGEICVSGTCLSPGYYNDPDKTAAAFGQLEGPVRETVYHTGDLGCINERGELMYLGRRDWQIKRNGYRIELGEIESVLSSLPDVGAACCVFDQASSRILCAWCGQAEAKAVRSGLRERLPRYMLPDVWQRLDDLPRTGNGKIDRMRLRQVMMDEHPDP